MKSFAFKNVTMNNLNYKLKENNVLSNVHIMKNINI